MQACIVSVRPYDELIATRLTEATTTQLLSLSISLLQAQRTQYITGRKQAVGTEHNTSPNKARTLFLFALSLANGLTSHNQTLVPTWLPSDSNRIAGLAASPTGVRTNLATRRLHTPLSCEYIGK